MTTFTAIPSPPFLATQSLHTDSFPTVLECTVAQAAKILQTSEGYVNEMLNAGHIAFRLKNGERLIRKNSLLEFANEQKWVREGLEEIVRLSEEMGLYDD